MHRSVLLSRYKPVSYTHLDAHGELALHAYEETGRGVFEDKATKNLFACEHVVNNMRHTKTVGVIQEDDVTGLTLSLIHILIAPSMELALVRLLVGLQGPALSSMVKPIT